MLQGQYDNSPSNAGMAPVELFVYSFYVILARK